MCISQLLEGGHLNKDSVTMEWVTTPTTYEECRTLLLNIGDGHILSILDAQIAAGKKRCTQLKGQPLNQQVVCMQHMHFLVFFYGAMF